MKTKKTPESPLNLHIFPPHTIPHQTCSSPAGNIVPSPSSRGPRRSVPYGVRLMAGLGGGSPCARLDRLGNSDRSSCGGALSPAPLSGGPNTPIMEGWPPSWRPGRPNAPRAVRPEPTLADRGGRQNTGATDHRDLIYIEMTHLY